jgi:hypothetical protein
VRKPFDQRRYVARIVLQVAIQQHDHLAPGVTDAMQQRGGLALIAGKPEGAEKRVRLAASLQLVPGAIVAAVVHHDRLEAGQRCVQPAQLVEQRAYVAGLVVDGNDNGHTHGV